MARLLANTFDDGSGDGNIDALPSGWQKADSGDMTVYEGQTDSDLGPSQPTVGWVFGDDHTTSSSTGPGGGMDNDLDATTGTWNLATEHRYMYVETSGVGASHSIHRYHLIRTSPIDLSAHAPGSKIVLKFWFHKFGSAQDENHLGIAATTATNDASNASEAGAGLGFTSDTEGGAYIEYWTAHDGSTTESAHRITGQQQTSGHTSAQADANLWRLAEADISAAAGQSTVYIYFLVVTHNIGAQYRQDVGVENMQVIAFKGGQPIRDDYDLHNYEIIQSKYEVDEPPFSLASPGPRHLKGRLTAYNVTLGGNK